MNETFEGVEFCSELSDVPELKGPIMPSSAVLLLPPIDISRLLSAYIAARWNLCVRIQDTEQFWKSRNKPADSYEAYWREHAEGIPPTLDRLTEILWQAIREVKSGCNYTQGAGLIVFRSKSGRIGVIVESVIGLHYKRIKEAGKSEQMEVLPEH